MRLKSRLCNGSHFVKGDELTFKSSFAMPKRHKSPHYLNLRALSIHPLGPLKANASCTELNLSSFMEICRRCPALPTNKPHGLILIGLDVRNVRWLLDEPPALVFMHPRVHCRKKIAFSLEKICTWDFFQYYNISLVQFYSDANDRVIDRYIDRLTPFIIEGERTFNHTSIPYYTMRTKPLLTEPYNISQCILSVTLLILIEKYIINCVY